MAERNWKLPENTLEFSNEDAMNAMPTGLPPGAAPSRAPRPAARQFNNTFRPAFDRMREEQNAGRPRDFNNPINQAARMKEDRGISRDPDYINMLRGAPQRTDLWSRRNEIRSATMGEPTRRSLKAEQMLRNQYANEDKLYSDYIGNAYNSVSANRNNIGSRRSAEAIAAGRDLMQLNKQEGANLGYAHGALTAQETAMRRQDLDRYINDAAENRLGIDQFYRQATTDGDERAANIRDYISGQTLGVGAGRFAPGAGENFLGALGGTRGRDAAAVESAKRLKAYEEGFEDFQNKNPGSTLEDYERYFSPTDPVANNTARARSFAAGTARAQDRVSPPGILGSEADRIQLGEDYLEGIEQPGLMKRLAGEAYGLVRPIPGMGMVLDPLVKQMYPGMNLESGSALNNPLPGFGDRIVRGTQNGREVYGIDYGGANDPIAARANPAYPGDSAQGDPARTPVTGRAAPDKMMNPAIPLREVPGAVRGPATTEPVLPVGRPVDDRVGRTFTPSPEEITLNEQVAQVARGMLEIGIAPDSADEMVRILLGQA